MQLVRDGPKDSGGTMMCFSILTRKNIGGDIEFTRPGKRLELIKPNQTANNCEPKWKLVVKNEK